MARNGIQSQQPQGNNVWAQMGYTPPRGPCGQKVNILTSCPCYRFMIHPLKAATSFDCDGCGHHASFHQMKNREDEENLRLDKRHDQICDTLCSEKLTQANREVVATDWRAERLRQCRQLRELEDAGMEGSEGTERTAEEVEEIPRVERKRRRTGAG